MVVTCAQLDGVLLVIGLGPKAEQVSVPGRSEVHVTVNLMQNTPNAKNKIVPNGKHFMNTNESQSLYGDSS